MVRKKSKKVNIFFIVIMLVILGYCYYKFDPSRTIQNKDDQNEITNTKIFSNDLKIEKQTLNLKPAWYKEINSEYPIGDVVGVLEVEKFVRTKVDKLLCVNDEEKLTEIQAKKKVDVSTYECSLDIKYSYTHSKKLLSHKLSVYGMYGGVHGIYTADTFTYDTNGNQLTLADLVINKETYKKDFSSLLKTGFKKYQDENKDTNFDSVLDEITVEGAIDTVPYMATNDGLVFLFSEINGLPFGAGEVEIKILFSELSGLIKPEFLD